MVLLASCTSTSNNRPDPSPPPDTCGSAPECGPSAEQFFDDRKLAEIRLTSSETDLEAIRVELKQRGYELCPPNTVGEGACTPVASLLDLLWAKWQHCGPYKNYIPVTMEYQSPDGVGNVVLSKVGMRLRGTNSRYSNPLQGFKLNFETLLADQSGGVGRRFGGGSRLNALTVDGDDTLMLQCQAYGLMRAFGVPAPRCNHLKVYVNGEYYGLMQNAEEPDEGSFLRHAFGDANDEGSLYKCSAGCGYDDFKADLEYYGDGFTEQTAPGAQQPGMYPKAYNLVRGEPGAHEVDLIPMFKCGGPESTPDDAAFASCIQEWIDVAEWLRVIAAESLMPTVESFVGSKRNYYLYFKPEAGAPHGGRFSVYSWDLDAAFNRAGCLPSSCDPFTSVASWYTGGGRARLVQRLIRVFKDRYCAAMRSFLSDLYDPGRVDRAAAVLETAMAGLPIPFVDRRDVATAQLVPREPLTHGAWSAAVATLRDYVAAHRAAAQAQVDARCSAASAP